MISRKLLRKLTPEVIKQALAVRSKLLKTERLAERRQKLMTTLALVEREIAKLDGEPVRRRGPGRPPKARTVTRKPGRRKGFKLSTETREKRGKAALARYAKKREAEPVNLGA